MAKLETYNAQYAQALGQWSRCRDVIAGQDTVHAAGVKYLPKLSGQDKDAYDSYKHRATLFNAAGRTLDALSGMVFAAKPRATIPSGMADWVQDVTLSGCSLDNLAKMLVEDQIAVGRVGLIVEHPQNELDNITVGQAEALNIRPYIRMYKAEAIHDWRESSVNGRVQLSMVKLFESIEQPVDEFNSVMVDQYRVLDLFNGVYRVRLFQRDKNKEGEWLLVGESFPQRNNAPIGEIPFVIINTAALGCMVDKPPMLDLVDQNLAHYRNTADFEHGLHFTGLPTPVVAGVQLDAGQTLSIGSSSAWVFPDPGAKATYLEFTGAGLTALSNELKAKEHRMAVLGARMLDEQKRTAESTDTTQLKYSGEHSVLASIAKTCAEGIRKALEIMAQWGNVSGTIEYSLNTEYGVRTLTAQELTAYVAAWQQGAISKETLFQNLQTGSIISDDTTFEDEEAKIADAAPQLTVPQGETEEPTGVLQRIRDRLGV